MRPSDRRLTGLTSGADWWFLVLAVGQAWKECGARADCFREAMFLVERIKREVPFEGMAVKGKRKRENLKMLLKKKRLVRPTSPVIIY